MILQGLQTALDSAPRPPKLQAQDTDRTAITYTSIYTEWGISGTANSADRRRALLARLGLLAPEQRNCCKS